VGKVLTLVALVALSAGTASAVVERTRVIGRASASGDFAIALASGRARNPDAVFARLTSRPSQRVEGSWTMVCSKGFGAGSKSGRYAARTPFTRRLRFPMTNPSDCTVSASGQLARSGRVVVTLLKQP
jgi:hypothetical protein